MVNAVVVACLAGAGLLIASVTLDVLLRRDSIGGRVVVLKAAVGLLVIAAAAALIDAKVE